LIVVSLGTYEQPFNRLLEIVDNLRIEQARIVQYESLRTRFRSAQDSAFSSSRRCEG